MRERGTEGGSEGERDREGGREEREGQRQGVRERGTGREGGTSFVKDTKLKDTPCTYIYSASCIYTC